ncbi:SLAC1 anion channel family protein [Cereibacter sphaeroides]|uniref:SLAC1 anion channel family protein n=1 Tax=Cereibacter sphaeroides TaxID=1063 RepID=UPI001F31397F|nr:SLAC1 anion channel family protein [Cereibacter sphaeroides]MCE6959152.1 SLAC1 anion channel family protein [Cereibacter sphaeroides]MCE6968393.1 SLAC1 anion channel family protein [Cereibacter sphaeroides]MCE6974187.1 SLAC1 anion channel family protein [Cereibacter sphaeroides]
MEASPTLTAGHSRLAHYPVAFFTLGMGMMGLTLALRAGEGAFGLGPEASRAALVLSLTLLGLVAAGYLAKALFHPAAVAADWHHPVRIAFFPAMPISLLLLSVALLDEAPSLAGQVWIAGAVLQALLALSVIAAWIGHRPFSHAQLTPVWFIPAVGNVIVPISGVPLGHPEIAWLFFSGGLVFWIVLLTLVMNRLMFHDPLPGRMVPTLMILVAPPAVSFVAWLKLTGEVGAFGHILLSIAYVFALIVGTQLPKFARMPFALSWWALSFPLAALTIASFAYAEAAASADHRMIGAGLLGLLVLVVSGLVLRTLLGIWRHEICRPE